MAQKRLTTSGKLIISVLSVVVLFLGLKVTGLWDRLVPDGQVKESSIPVISGVNRQIPGTKSVRLAHWTWNSHQAWALANKGKTTAPDSLFAKHGLTVQFMRVEEIPLQIAALKTFAQAFKKGNPQPKEGVHFFTIMGDAGGWVLNDTNKALQKIDSSYQAEIIGFSGFSAGEDKFMGPPEWKKNPASARGGVVAGVPADGDWNIMIFWCAQNQIPFNSDKRYYDPQALNFVETDSFIKAGELYIAEKPLELKFKSDGKDFQGKPVKKGNKGLVAINGVVTWTPVDKNIADHRGGLVSIASTKEYSNQMPQFIIGLKQWNQANQETVVNLLAAIFTASDLIIDSDKKLKAGKISTKSDDDYRWKAAQHIFELFDSKTPEYWYTYYDVVPVKDKMGLTVEVGGSSVSNLQRNLKFFGLDGGTDIGEVVYNQFAKLAKHYYPDFIKSYPPWNQVFNPVYLKAASAQFPALANTDPNLPTFGGATTGALLGEMTYRIPFPGGSSMITPKAEKVLKEPLDQLLIAANSRVEIHGHTASTCPQESCLETSRERSEAVLNWLKKRAGSSFPEGRVKVIPHGKAELLVQDQVNGRFVSAKGELNRRVVIKIFAN